MSDGGCWVAGARAGLAAPQTRAFAVASTDNQALSVWRAGRHECGDAVQSAAPEGALQSIARGVSLQPVAPPAASQALQMASLPPEIARYLQGSSAAATRRAYQGDVADLLRWGGSVPCTPMTLARYIVERAQCHRPSTVARRVVGIGRAHVAYGFPDPSKDALVRAVLRGVRREHGAAQRRAAPLLLADLLLMLAGLPADLRGQRDRALLLLGFAGGLRRSEIVHLDVDDLRFVADGMHVRLRRSKTDQERVGRVIAIPRGRTAACAVSAMREWLAASGIVAGPVFRAFCGSQLTPRRLPDQAVSLMVKAQVAALGRPPSAYSGHSLRAGFITSAAQAGVGFLMIQQQTGHRSVSMLTRYLRSANLFEGNAAGAIL
jgi:integrase